MNCDEVRTLIDAYADNELDLMTSLAIERHLQTCPDCPTIYQNRLTLRSALNMDALYFRPSSVVRGRLMQAVHHADRERFNRIAGFRPQMRWIGAIGLVAVVLLVAGLIVVRNATLAPASDPLVADVLASHVRSLLVDHLTDVLSTDQHTVKPWFDGKLPYAPTVVDLAAEGFPLEGGRLDYVENHAVAALVYRSDKHPINLFIWPTADLPDSAQSAITLQGYHMLHWTAGSMTYWAVSDVEIDKLSAFADFLKRQ